MSDHNHRTKHLRRPVKSPAEKARRMKEQKKRLVALGMTEAEVAKMNADVLRTLLHRPMQVVARVAKKKAAAEKAAAPAE